MQTRAGFSISDYEFSVEEEEEAQEEQSELWSVSSVAESEGKLPSRSKSIIKSKSKSFSKVFSKSFSKFVMSKTLQKSFSSRMKGSQGSTVDESFAATDDDIQVHVLSRKSS